MRVLALRKCGWIVKHWTIWTLLERIFTAARTSLFHHPSKTCLQQLIHIKPPRECNRDAKTRSSLATSRSRQSQLLLLKTRMLTDFYRVRSTVYVTNVNNWRECKYWPSASMIQKKWATSPLFLIRWPMLLYTTVSANIKRADMIHKSSWRIISESIKMLLLPFRLCITSGWANFISVVDMLNKSSVTHLILKEMQNEVKQPKSEVSEL